MKELTAGELIKLATHLQGKTGIGKMNYAGNKEVRQNLSEFKDFFAQIPVGDHTSQRYVINGHPVIASFSKEKNPGVYERIKNILIASAFTNERSKDDRER